MKNLLPLCVIFVSLSACADDNAPNTQKQETVQPTEAVASDAVKTVADTAATTHHQGESLHNEKCTSCHKDDVYTREDRMVKTMSALEHQVNNCMRGAAKAEWTQPQTTSVVDFLNDRYYKF